MQLLAWLVLGYAGYLLLAGEISASELIAGVPVALLCVLIGVALRRAARRPMPWPDTAAWRDLIDAAARTLPDAARVGAALVSLIWQPREAMGSLSEQRNGWTDAAADRALRLISQTLTPASVACDLRPHGLTLHVFGRPPP